MESSVNLSAIENDINAIVTMGSKKKAAEKHNDAPVRDKLPIQPEQKVKTNDQDSQERQTEDEGVETAEALLQEIGVRTRNRIYSEENFLHDKVTASQSIYDDSQDLKR